MHLILIIAVDQNAILTLFWIFVRNTKKQADYWRIEDKMNHLNINKKKIILNKTIKHRKIKIPILTMDRQIQLQILQLIPILIIVQQIIIHRLQQHLIQLLLIQLQLIQLLLIQLQLIQQLLIPHLLIQHKLIQQHLLIRVLQQQLQRVHRQQILLVRRIQ